MAAATSETALGELAAALPDGALLTDRDVVAGYRHDWAKDPDAGWPVAIVRATCTADVQTAVRWAARHRVPLVLYLWDLPPWWIGRGKPDFIFMAGGRIRRLPLR